MWQKPTQYCKAIILQLRINKLKKRAKKWENCMVYESHHQKAIKNTNENQDIWNNSQIQLQDSPK